MDPKIRGGKESDSSSSDNTGGGATPEGGGTDPAVSGYSLEFVPLSPRSCASSCCKRVIYLPPSSPFFVFLCADFSFWIDDNITYITPDAK